MSRGLHLLGYDQKRMALAVISPLAEGFAQGATRQRGSVTSAQATSPSTDPSTTPATTTSPAPSAPPPEKSNTAWYVAGGVAVVAVLVALLARSQ